MSALESALAPTSNTRNTPRIYVACLAAYNEGRLHGAWIDADQDAEGMETDIQAMMDASPTKGEEWAIHDSENMPRLEEGEDLETIAKIAEMMAEHGEIFSALVDLHSTVDEAVTAIEDCYEGEWASIEDWAESWLEDTGSLQNVPENLRYYIDFEKWARDAEMGGDIYTLKVNGSVHVFNSL